MPETREERLRRIHHAALVRFDKIQSVLKDERQNCLEDRRFYSIAGAQWEGDLGKEFANKPQLEINKIHLAVFRIINEYRSNRITARFVAKDGKADEDLAETCAGLFRADEQDSTAEEAYDNAFEEAVGGGFGAVRLRAVYEDEDDPENEHQRIRIEPVPDADSSVFFDLDSKRQDKADAKFCFVIHSLTRDGFIAEYGDDKNPASWDKDISAAEFDWATPDTVHVAEYFAVEEASDEYVKFKGPADEVRLKRSELDAFKLAELKATGYVELSSRKIKTRAIHKYVLSGCGVLEDSGLIAGQRIPVIPVYGKRWFVDGVERCMGHVRLAKDAQRLKNMQMSKLAELSAQSSIEKPMLAPEQVAGHEDMWADDVMENYPYLLINPISNADGTKTYAGPIGYTKPPAIPPVLAALMQMSDQDMRDVLGNPEQAEKLISNVADKTVARIQERLDMQTVIYVSNFAKAVRTVGEVWLSMAKDLYVEEGRVMKTTTEDGEQDSVTLLTAAADPNTQALVKAADLSRAKFDVSVSVGPSSTSRRAAVRQALTEILGVTQDAETAQVLQSMLIVNMEDEGLSDVRDYFHKKLLRMGAIKPTKEEQAELAREAQSSPPDANSEALRGMAAEAQAKAMKARVDVLQVLANVELTKAKVKQIAAEISADQRDAILREIDKVDTTAILPGVKNQGEEGR